VPFPDELAFDVAVVDVLLWSPLPFVPTVPAFPAAAPRITARPTTRTLFILAFFIRQHRPVIYSTPLPRFRFGDSSSEQLWLFEPSPC
jgi:hypothetical protein